MLAAIKLSPADLTFPSLLCDQSQVAASLWAMAVYKLCSFSLWTLTGTLDTLHAPASHFSSSSVGRDNGKPVSAQLGRGQAKANVMDPLTSRWYQEGIAIFSPLFRTGRKTVAGWGDHMGNEVQLEAS